MGDCWSGFGWMGAGMLFNVLLGLGLLVLVVVGVMVAVTWLVRAGGELRQDRSGNEHMRPRPDWR